MKVVFYKYPNEEDESVLVSDVILTRDSSVAVLVSREDIHERNNLYFLESDEEGIRCRLAEPDYTNEDLYFVNYGPGIFEAVLPFPSHTDAKAFAEDMKKNMITLEDMWNEE